MDIKVLLEKLEGTGENIRNPRVLHKIYNYLPVPKDFNIKWAEINSYGGRPSGIVLTDRGIICKSPAIKIKGQKKRKSVYQYVPWDYYDPNTISVRRKEKCYELYFGDSLIAKYYNEKLNDFFDGMAKEHEKDCIINAAIAEELIVGDLEAVAFNAAYGKDNTKTGHGIYAEEAGAKLDRLHGEKVAVVGRDNAKNGPDKIVNQYPVQCKYYRTADNSVGACFKKNPETGEMIFRYYHLDGKTPMMVEVPKDQYDKAIKLLENRIRKGQVPGVTDPDVAKTIIRKGKLTYKQTVNLAKAGTIESLTYDITTGIVTCTAIGGISALTVFAITYWQTKDKKNAAKASLAAGLEVFGPAFAGRVLAQQIARTSIPNALIPLSKAITDMMKPQTVQSILNAFRNMAGKKSIYGVAAQKSFAKALRTNVLTQVIIFGVTSVPDTVKVIQRKITIAQYSKNITSGIGALAGGSAGAVLGAKLGSKLPVAAKSAGAVGGAAGGFIFGFTVRGIGSLIKEDDSVIYNRMFNSTICSMSVDYILSEKEVNELMEMLDNDQKEIKKLFMELVKTEEQFKHIEDFLTPYFDRIANKREVIGKDEELEMCRGIDEAMVEISEEEHLYEM